MKTDVKPCMSQDVRKNTCMFYRKNKDIKRITLCVL